MQARGEVVGHDREGVRRQMRGRLQGRADIPAMDGEFKDARVDHSVHRDQAARMIAGLVPLVRGEGDNTMMELVPGVPKHGHQVVAKTRAERDGPWANAVARCRRSSPERVVKRWGAGKPAGEGEVSPRRPRVMRSVYPCAIPLRCATTSRMSQRAQALGCVQASAGKVVR